MTLRDPPEEFGGGEARRPPQGCSEGWGGSRVYPLAAVPSRSPPRAAGRAAPRGASAHKGVAAASARCADCERHHVPRARAAARPPQATPARAARASRSLSGCTKPTVGIAAVSLPRAHLPAQKTLGPDREGGGFPSLLFLSVSPSILPGPLAIRAPGPWGLCPTLSWGDRPSAASCRCHPGLPRRGRAEVVLPELVGYFSLGFSSDCSLFLAKLLCSLSPASSPFPPPWRFNKLQRPPSAGSVLVILLWVCQELVHLFSHCYLKGSKVKSDWL